MKVIFLDIDGVLNSQQESVSGNVNGTFDYEGINRVSLGLLRLVVELTDAKIVISSTWRHDGYEGIAGAFEAQGWRGLIMRKIIIGITPWLTGVRGDEIQHWIDEQGDVTDYVIIDDDSDMLDDQIEHFVHTDGVIGFNIYDAVRVLDILGVENDPEKQKRSEEIHSIVKFKLDKREKGCDYSL